MSRFRDRVRKGLDRIDSYAGIIVTYQRGGQSLVGVPAVPAATELETTDSEGVTTFRRTRDFKINAADLPIGEPAAGDTIIEIIDGQATTFEVFKPSTNDKPWRWTDQGRTRYRIHTREIS
jgi:hypothetical protein